MCVRVCGHSTHYVVRCVLNLWPAKWLIVNASVRRMALNCEWKWDWQCERECERESKCECGRTQKAVKAFSVATGKPEEKEGEGESTA